MTEADPIARLNAALNGRYRIERKLGEGGMATVYHAVQSQPVERQVALKVLKPGQASEQLAGRFDAERQTLAVMDHPSIAKIFDAGVLDDGRPFFVMELVDGVPLTEYCDERRLDLRERIRLFIDVCRGVQHAHQKGVVHRDLKPTNVLVSEVDGRPLPRIIDFGIAKAIQHDDFDGARLTRDDQVIGTPAYMSPEQLDGSLDVDTRCDVYALGVLLFELLSGSLPYDRDKYRGWVAVAAQIARDAPTPARRFADLEDTQETVARDRSTTPALLRRRLSGDLGWIVARAMERDRERRYETVNALALDLERHLAHEPVRARAAGAAYVLGRFVRRNRLGVAFGATIAAGLVSFSVVTSIQADRIADARDEAETRRTQAEGLIDFMLSDLRMKLEPLGRLELLDDVGAQAIEYFSSMPNDRYSDEELASRSQALYQIGDVRLDQGDFEAAVDAFSESLRLAKALSDRAPDHPERLFGLAQSYFWVGYAAWLSGNLDAAEEQFLGYLEAAERMVELAPDDPTARVELGYAHGNLGSVWEARGDLAAAAEAHRQSLEAERWIVDQDPNDVDALGELAESYNKLAVVSRKRGDFELAREQHEEELALKIRLLELAPDHAYWRYRFAMTLGFLSLLDEATGALEDGLGLRRRQVATLDSLVASDPANRDRAEELAVAIVGVGRILFGLERFQEADQNLERAEARLEQLVAVDSTSFGWHVDLAETRTLRARVDLARGVRDLALDRVDAAVALFSGGRESNPDRIRAVADAHLVRGHALHAAGRHTEARIAWEDARLMAETLTPISARNEMRLLAELYLVLDLPDEARPLLERLQSSGYVDRDLRALASAKGLRL